MDLVSAEEKITHLFLSWLEFWRHELPGITEQFWLNVCHGHSEEQLTNLCCLLLTDLWYCLLEGPNVLHSFSLAWDAFHINCFVELRSSCIAYAFFQQGIYSLAKSTVEWNICYLITSVLVISEGTACWSSFGLPPSLGPWPLQL